MASLLVIRCKNPGEAVKLSHSLQRIFPRDDTWEYGAEVVTTASWGDAKYHCDNVTVHDVD